MSKKWPEMVIEPDMCSQFYIETVYKSQTLSIFSSSHLAGCGVTTSSSGVKIDIDEDPPYRPTSNLTDASRPWWPTGNNNPSIGEVSLGASLSMGSGCILENAGMFFFVNLVFGFCLSSLMHEFQKLRIVQT